MIFVSLSSGVIDEIHTEEDKIEKHVDSKVKDTSL